MRRVYLDHAATTPVDPRVLKKMLPCFSECFANPESQHSFGRAAADAADAARDTIAKAIGAKSSEIYFTSGGTESCNWALRGYMRANAERGRHFIVSAAEHPAVLETAKDLEREGFSCSVAGVDAFGRTDVSALRGLIREDTVLVAVMAANNETGTVQPVKQIAALAHACGAAFFTDAVQAAGVLPVDVNEWGADMLAFSSHKFYGPKGAGVLFVHTGTRLGRFVAGGHQERGLRGGTTNVAGVAGMAEALALAVEEREENALRVKAVRDRFLDRVLKEIPRVTLNGHPAERLPGNANLCFHGVGAEQLLAALDLKGIAASAGSACTSGSPEPSHVLLAMGLSAEDAKSSLRFTFGKDNTAEDADYAADTLKTLVGRLRDYAGEKE